MLKWLQVPFFFFFFLFFFLTDVLLIDWIRQYIRYLLCCVWQQFVHLNVNSINKYWFEQRLGYCVAISWKNLLRVDACLPRLYKFFLEAQDKECLFWSSFCPKGNFLIVCCLLVVLARFLACLVVFNVFWGVWNSEYFVIIAAYTECLWSRYIILC